MIKKNSGFTLIELLVVIAVIGILASIIIITLKSPIEKARIAGGEEFESSLRHAFFSDASGIWTFDSGSLADSSGFNNTATANGGVAPTANRKGEDNQAYSFDGLDDYLRVPDSTSLDLTSAITIAAWVYPRDVDTGKIVTKKTSSSGYVLELTSSLVPQDTLMVSL